MHRGVALIGVENRHASWHTDPVLVEQNEQDASKER